MAHDSAEVHVDAKKEFDPARVYLKDCGGIGRGAAHSIDSRGEGVSAPNDGRDLQCDSRIYPRALEISAGILRPPVEGLDARFRGNDEQRRRKFARIR